jgi:hypothetical protein
LAPKWYEYAEKRLKKGEEIEKNYEGTLDGNFGYLFITNQRLLFVKQEGFLRKSHELILDLPQENVEKMQKVDNYQMEIVESDGKKHVFESTIGVSIIKEGIEEVASLD